MTTNFILQTIGAFFMFASAIISIYCIQYIIELKQYEKELLNKINKHN